MVVPGPEPRNVMLLLTKTKLPSAIVKVPGASSTTCPDGHAAMALLMCVESSAPPPIGLTLAQTVVLFGIPPTESIPAICQFALALLSAGNRLPIMALSLPPELGDVGDKGSFPTLRAVLLGAVPTGRVASICPLFICQMVSEPVSWFSHMMSLVPSPLKS